MRPDVIAGQIEVIPAERRQVAKSLIIDGDALPTTHRFVDPKRSCVPTARKLLKLKGRQLMREQETNDRALIHGLSWSQSDPNRNSTNGKWCNAKVHSPLMLAALMVGHHFSISALCSAPTASGVC